MIEDLIRIIRENTETIEDIGRYGDIVFRLRDDMIDVHITKMIRCAVGACEEAA